ncbi:MAG: DUF4037 domain-containing protein [Calditrichae bacterium]|nr:DUF4037 domain-containing protein [Calditrichia bacterium]
MTSGTHTELADRIADCFKEIPDVMAITLGGSSANHTLDPLSDIDLYIYSESIVPLEKRKKLIEKLGYSKANFNLTFWDTGDEWFDSQTGIEIDVMYWAPKWIEDQIDKVLIRCEANLGYTTCFWRTVKNSHILFDRSGWFTELQKKSHAPYPSKLKKAIIKKNHPVLRTVIPSYFEQIKKAIARDDLLSISHRLAALFASYFDILFAVNEVLNPGEKRVLQFALDECRLLPDNSEKTISQILIKAGSEYRQLPELLTNLLNALDFLLQRESLLPAIS